MKQNIFLNDVRVGALCAGLAVLGAAHSEPIAAQYWRYTIKPQDQLGKIGQLQPPARCQHYHGG
jgi:hypothetical protein